MSGGAHTLLVDLLRALMNAVKEGAGKVRVLVVGAFESRTAMWVGLVAISTHSLPSPGPE